MQRGSLPSLEETADPKLRHPDSATSVDTRRWYDGFLKAVG